MRISGRDRERERWRETESKREIKRDRHRQRRTHIRRERLGGRGKEIETGSVSNHILIYICFFILLF